MRHRLHRALRAAGVVCLTASAFCFASDAALRAAPLLAVRLRIPFATPQLALDVPAPSAAPVASPGPVAVVSPSDAAVSGAAAHRRGFLGDGPIVLKGTGTYQLALNRSARDGFLNTSDTYSSALSVVAERRTEQSALSVTSAFGYSPGALQAGSLLAAYRTPKYGFSWGQVSGPSDSQLNIGGFARGVALAVPLRNGDVSLLASTAQQPDATTYRIYGVRRTWNGLGGYLSLAQYVGASEQGAGREAITDFSFQRYGAALATQTELALSRTGGMAGVSDGAALAAAFHADLQGKNAFSTLSLRYDPNGLRTLTGPQDAGFSADLALRRHLDRLGDVDLDLGHLDDRSADSVSHDDRVTLSGTRAWNRVAVQYVLGVDATRSNGSTSLQRTGALTLSESIKDLSLFETVQTAGVSATSGAAQQVQTAFGASHPLLGGTGAYQIARNVQGGGASSGTDLAQSFSFRHALGRKADAQVAETLDASVSNGFRSTDAETSLTLVRRLSHVVALQVGGAVSVRTGIGAGRTSSVQASLVGPFGFGQPTQAFSGRSNPNLPAVIRGIVVLTAGSSPFATQGTGAPRGLNNALVVLDGRVTQRTDAAGEFEFRFVPQGTHTVRIDPATLAPGLIADREYQTLSVLGGQTGTLSFNVGNFAGVTGRVLVTDASGATHGVPDVGIAIDGIQAVTTAPDGHYAVGRLNPGPHTVEIVESTLPSTVAFVGEKKKTVTVTAGSATPLDFAATRLGSIAGSVMAPGDGGFGSLAGLHNVYVVAQPGEHAVITDDDGSFLLDNLPPGSYTLSVDPDTIPDGLGVLSGPDGALVLGGGAALSGVIFKLGESAKKVLYTFNDGKRLPIQLVTDPLVVPPGALLRVTARTSAKDVAGLAVESDVFGGFPLRFDRTTGTWSGSALVPSLAKGDYALTVTAHRKDVDDAQTLVQVDPRLPLFALRMSPRDPEPGHTVRVTLKALAPVSEGDALVFEDGYRVALPAPRGRVFGFSMRLWRKGLPYAANLVTKRGQTYPLTLR